MARGTRALRSGGVPPPAISIRWARRESLLRRSSVPPKQAAHAAQRRPPTRSITPPLLRRHIDGNQIPIALAALPRLAIAARAGVERPTVYRHFPTTEALFAACSSHHWAQNPRPDPDGWLGIKDPKARLRKGLGDIYSHYTTHETELWNILRDFEDEPELRRFATRSIQYREHVLEVLGSTWQGRKDAKTIRAVIGHSIDFFAWRSLRRQGLTDDEAIELMVGLAHSI